jgi:cysteine desulfuration protein SufE
MNCSDLDTLGSSAMVENSSIYPTGLQSIVDLFISLPEEERRDALISYAEQSNKWAPHEGDKFELEDVRKDEECTDTVGVFLDVDPAQRVRFRVSLGPQVQTLTKAMTSILCRGLQGATVEEVMDLPSDFVPKIIGTELVRARSHTVYYVLTRIKGILSVYIKRKRAEAS